MLTVLIRNATNPASLAATLAPLVAGAVEGLVRDVVVLDATDAEVRRVADHAGCRLASEEAVRAGAQGLKGEWVLLLEAGDRLASGWVEAAAFHAASRPAERLTAGLLPTEGAVGLLGRLLKRRGALLVPKAHLVRHAKSSTALAGLRRGIRVRRLTVRRS